MHFARSSRVWSAMLFLTVLPATICAYGIGQRPPVEYSLNEANITCEPSNKAFTPDFESALTRLLKGPQTAPELGDSGLKTRRRCWQQNEDGPCSNIVVRGGAAIEVCGNAYASMLCEDVAYAVEDILKKCRDDGQGGEAVVKDGGEGPRPFAVKIHRAEEGAAET